MLNIFRKDFLQTRNFLNYFSIFLLISSVLIFLFFTIQRYSQKSARFQHYHEDIFSELNAYTAGINFNNLGFKKLFFLPVIEKVEIELPENYRTNKFLYTHYPGGPDIVSGFLLKTGIQNFYLQKIFLLIISLFTIFVLFKIFSFLLKDDDHKKSWTRIGLAFFISSPCFIFWAGNLHQASYNDFFMCLGLLGAISGKLYLLFLAGFFSGFFSFETAPYLFILGFYPSLINLKNKTWNYKKIFIFLLTLGLIISIPYILHFIQNSIALGSAKNALRDLTEAATLRIEGVGKNAISYSLFKHSFKFFVSSLWFFGSFMIFACLYGGTKSKNNNKTLFWVLLFASLVWQFFMRQHAMVHAFTPRHLFLFTVIFSLFGIRYLFQKNFSNFKKSIAILICLLIVFRLPFGAESSENKCSIKLMEKFANTMSDYAVAKTLFNISNNYSHKKEFQKLLDILVKRNNLAQNQEVYIVKNIPNQNDILELVRYESDYLIKPRAIPDKYIIQFNDTENFYFKNGLIGNTLEKFDPKIKEKNTMIISDSFENKYEKFKYLFLNFYILLI